MSLARQGRSCEGWKFSTHLETPSQVGTKSTSGSQRGAQQQVDGKQWREFCTEISVNQHFLAKKLFACLSQQVVAGCWGSGFWIRPQREDRSCWRGCREKRILLHYLWECKLIWPPWKQYGDSLKRKQGIHLSYDPEIPLLGSYHEKTSILKDTCTTKFTTALFTIARTWKQFRCPLKDEWIKKLWYIYLMRYYLAIKRNGYESVAVRWMKLEPLIHSEVRKRKTIIAY